MIDFVFISLTDLKKAIGSNKIFKKDALKNAFLNYKCKWNKELKRLALAINSWDYIE